MRLLTIIKMPGRHILRTSHEQRRRSSAVVTTDQGQFLSALDANQRRLSGSSLETLGIASRERRPSYTLDGKLSPVCSQELRSSSGVQNYNNSLPSMAHRRSCDHKKPLIKRFSTLNMELKSTSLWATLCIIGCCCVLIAALSYLIRHYGKDMMGMSS